MQRIARALGMSDAAQGLQALARDNGAPTALKDIGMQEADLDRAADLAVSNPYWNPRPFGPAERGAIRALLQRAYEGAPPA
jgi:alcohol dehydrogenase class IV